MSSNRPIRWQPPGLVLLAAEAAVDNEAGGCANRGLDVVKDPAGLEL